MLLKGRAAKPLISELEFNSYFVSFPKLFKLILVEEEEYG